MNRNSYAYSYNRILIGTYTLFRCKFEWPWVTPKFSTIWSAVRPQYDSCVSCVCYPKLRRFTVAQSRLTLQRRQRDDWLSLTAVPLIYSCLTTAPLIRLRRMALYKFVLIDWLIDWLIAVCGTKATINQSINQFINIPAARCRIAIKYSSCNKIQTNKQTN